MAFAMIKRLSTGVVPIILLFGLLLVSLYLMGRATQNSEEFGRLYVSLLVINISLLVLLMVLIGANMVQNPTEMKQADPVRSGYGEGSFVVVRAEKTLKL